MSTAEVNREKQTELYGEPLTDIAGRITSAFNLTQTRLAAVLGLSAPMLSQLISGHRVKIGNPAVLGRLQALNDLAPQAPRLDAITIQRRLDEIQEATSTITGLQTGTSNTVAALRAAAPSAELLRLAQATNEPKLAALLRAASQKNG